MEQISQPYFVPSIERVTHAIAVWIERELRDIQLTQAEAHILAYLHHAGPSSINDLHRHFGHRRSTLTSVLDRLEGRGFLQRQPHPTSRRSVMVAPTAEGRPVADRVAALLGHLEATILDKTNGRDREGFYRILASIEEVCR